MLELNINISDVPTDYEDSWYPSMLYSVFAAEWFNEFRLVLLSRYNDMNLKFNTTLDFVFDEVTQCQVYDGEKLIYIKPITVNWDDVRNMNNNGALDHDD